MTTLKNPTDGAPPLAVAFGTQTGQVGLISLEEESPSKVKMELSCRAELPDGPPVNALAAFPADQGSTIVTGHSLGLSSILFLTAS